MIVGAGRLYFLLILAILAGAVALRLADPFILQGLRLIAFDAFQRLYPETYDPGLPVAIVDIDEESLGRVGQWPWPRTIMADLLDRLAAQGAAVVVFDILFAEADQTSPEQMVGSLPRPSAPWSRRFLRARRAMTRFSPRRSGGMLRCWRQR